MSTRDQILDAAWELFSERGFEDVSVRDVTNAAGVNLASVSYHFGSKTGLIQEVVKKTLNPANQHRLELLEKHASENGGYEKIPLRLIVDAFVRPVSFPEEHGSNQDIVARLAARYLIQRDYNVPNPVLVLFGEVFKKFIVAVKYQLPNLPEDVILSRFLFCTGATLHYQSFSGLAAKIAGHANAPDPEERYQQLLDFCVHGFGGKP